MGQREHTCEAKLTVFKAIEMAETPSPPSRKPKDKASLRSN